VVLAVPVDILDAARKLTNALTDGSEKVTLQLEPAPEAAPVPRT
jgi:hypothetical protein